MSWEGVGVIVSGLGVLASWAAIYLTYRHSRKSRERADEALDVSKKALAIEKRREEAETEERERRAVQRQKADFSVAVERGTAPNWLEKTIAIRNTGIGTARNVRVFVDGAPAEESPHVKSRLAPEPGATVTPDDHPLYFPIIAHEMSPTKLSVRIVWDDDFESDRSRTKSLNL